ncbi:MAG: ABC transporter permease subunit [Phycisphaerales bacterium]|nr:ABC transporter permease subunit [Phycisphaerales bacterium]
MPTIFKVRVFNFEVFTQLGAFNDTAAATILALPLVAVGLVAAAVERSAASMFTVRADDRDSGGESRSSRVGNVLAAALASILIALAVLAPLGAIAVESLDSRAFARAWAIARGPALNTVVYAGSAAVGATGIAFAVSWLGRGTDGRATAIGLERRAAEALMVLGFATPGAILALGLLDAFGSSAASKFAPPVVLVTAALVVRCVVVAQRVIDVGVGAIPSSLIEAAQLAGASGDRIGRSIIAPLIAPHLAVALAAAFVLSSAEIGSTILLYPPGGETLPIALYAVEANSPRSLVAALTMLLVTLPLVTAAGVAGVLAVLRWRRA